MRGHELDARIKGGRVSAKSTTSKDGEVDYDIQRLQLGSWECSCGEGPFRTEREAAEHLRSVKEGSDDNCSTDTESEQ